MGRMYAAVFEKVAVTAAQDLFQILAPAGSVVLVHHISLSVSTDQGDAAAEALNILIHRGSTNSSGGTTPTPTPFHLGDAAAGTVIEANNITSPATEGPFLHAESFNIMAGLSIWWTPETRPVVSPSDLFHIALQEAPVDSLTMNGTLIFEELGG